MKHLVNCGLFDERLTLSSFLVTSFVALVYLLSANSIQLPFAGFDFNPSKLAVLLVSPFLIIVYRRGIVHVDDLLFLAFVFVVLLKSLIFQDSKLASSLSNFVLPFLFYNAVRSHIRNINFRLLVILVLVFTVLHAGLGLLQFSTGNRELLIVDETSEHKLKYASSYAFNPFETLLLLPHGLYVYSSIFAMSLVFPLFLAAGTSVLFPLIVSASVFAAIVSTIFLCFSRFEILSVLLLVSLMTFVIKNGGRVIFWRLVLVGFVSIASVALYLAFTEDAVGSVSARVLTVDLFDKLLGDIQAVLWGIPSIFSFLDNYGFNVPHNMYFYLWIAYGLFGAVLFGGFLWVKAFQYLAFHKVLLKAKANTAARVFVYIMAFLLFLLLFRAFDYYIVDGYENIFLFFFCFLMLDKVIDLVRAAEAQNTHILR